MNFRHPVEHFVQLFFDSGAFLDLDQTYTVVAVFLTLTFCKLFGHCLSFLDRRSTSTGSGRGWRLYLASASTSADGGLDFELLVDAYRIFLRFVEDFAHRFFQHLCLCLLLFLGFTSHSS